MLVARGRSPRARAAAASRKAQRTHNVSTRGYKTAHPVATMRALEQGDGVFIDLRAPGLANLDGFQRIEFAKFISTPPSSLPREKKIYLVDVSGYHSEKAAQYLERAGFASDNIHVVEGGILKYMVAGGNVTFEDPAIDYRFKFLNTAQDTPVISPKYMLSLIDELAMQDRLVVRRNMFPIKHYSKLAQRTALWWAGPIRYFQLENIPVEQYRVPVIRDPKYRVPDPPKYWGWMPEWGVAYENIPKSPSTVTRGEITRLLQQQREAGLWDLPKPISAKHQRKKSPHGH